MGFHRRLSVVVAFAGLSLLVATGEEVSAGDAPAPPSVADFVRWSDFQDAKLSPDGKHLATTRIIKGRKVLQILRVADRQPVGSFGLSGERDVEDLYWPNNDRVLFGASDRIGSLGSATLTGELMQVRIDGSKPETLVAPMRASSYWLTSNDRDFDVVDLLRDDDDNILVSVFDDPSNWRVSNLYRWNTRTGLRTKLMEARLRGGSFYSDERQGSVRVQTGYTKDGERVLLARESDDASWEEISRFPFTEGGMWVAGYGPEPNQLYVTDDVEGGIEGLYLMNLGDKAKTLLFTSKDYELGHLIHGRDLNKPIGVTWEGERGAWKFFDDKHPDAVLFQSLRKALGDVDVSFTSFSKDRSLAVVAAGSDVMPRTYFVVDLAKPGLLARLPSRPWIDPAQMSPMQPIQFKARDGLDIHGYLTLPRNRGAGPSPMVVLVHGGPHGVRDTWGYDFEVQLLASRGYTVLQPNFRGSSGYGKKFEKAGQGQWGKAMEDDVIDATRWAIQQGHADAGRVCIFGGSYGAYAALEAVSVEPDLYRCAIGYAGVYDLEASIDGTFGSVSRDYWKKVMGDNVKDLDRHSPALHAERIKVPVFLAHGDDDRICPIGQFKAMRAALKDNGKVFEELVKDHEGHGFYNEDNKEELYTRLLAFLDKHTAPRPVAQ